MGKILRFFKKEPLVHFLVLGLILVAFNYYFERETENTLRISKAELQQYINALRGENLAAFGLEDSIQLAKAYITNQVLLAEAFKRGYDKYDPVITNRMIEKMKASLTDEIDPGDDDLRNYYEAHRLRYRMFEGISFRIVMLNMDNKTEADSLERLKKALNQDQPMDIPISAFTKISRFELMRAFGMAFTRTIDGLDDKKWEGPVQSSKGPLLVFVEEKHYTDAPPFEAVKAQVINDYAVEMSQKSFEKNFRQIEAKYKIRIDSIR